ncbi:DUF881 domain-containing protein [Actinotalea sp.]|uniref:DUF881 domain-containing protein n=1 Tax=Actinotalea sp. TaxID=1872145 RepID=UPI003569FB1D
MTSREDRTGKDLPGGRAPAGTAGARRPDASMALLNDLMARPTDPEYAEAAARPHAPQTTPQRLTRSGLEMVIAFVLGLVLVGAIVSLRTPQSAVTSSLLLLSDQIRERTEQADALAKENAALSADVDALQADLLAENDPELFEDLRLSELLSGAVGVTGPGLVVVLTDAPPDTTGQVDPEKRVQDIDVQIVVNGLFAAGAEAIAVNGQRLTALSAIRNVSIAILVDDVPLSSPYRIEAIGDVRSMQTAFARTSAADHLTLLGSAFDIAVATSAADELSLSGAGSTRLRYAQVPESVTSSGAGQEEQDS